MVLLDSSAELAKGQEIPAVALTLTFQGYNMRVKLKERIPKVRLIETHRHRQVSCRVQDTLRVPRRLQYPTWNCTRNKGLKLISLHKADHTASDVA